MDSNHVPCFLIREPGEFAHRSAHILWDPHRKALVLGQNQCLRLPGTDSAAALAQWTDAAPLAVDEFGQQGRIAASGKQIEYNAGRGFLPLVDDALKAVVAPAGEFSDLAIGGGGRLAAAYSNDTDIHGVVVFHLAKRWQLTVDLPEKPLRLLVDNNNATWCITRTLLICCEGGPLPHTYVPRRDRFEATSLNPHPLRIVWQMTIAATDRGLALCADANKLYVLMDAGAAGQAIVVRSLEASIEGTKRYLISDACPFAIDIGCVSPGRLALMAPQESGDSAFTQRDCPVVQLRWDGQAGTGEGMLIRERYPMLSQAVARFVSSADDVLRYQTEVAEDSTAISAGFVIQPRELHALQRPHYYSAAVATLTETLDSGQPDTVWHRIYLEGCIPPGCKCVLYAKAFNKPEERSRTAFIRQPDWLWCSHRSDRPFGKGLVNAIPNKQGLFELLLQRNAGPVRRLSGRYLQLRIRFEGDGQHTPAIHSLKIYYPRFSYQEAYLPEHFRQELGVDSSQDHLSANGADIRERMLAAFEATWTPLEGQITSAEILLSPEHTPEMHLPWLAELLGQTIPEHWPIERERRLLASTGVLQRWRGTLAGLNLVLDIVTDGAVSRGQIVLVENFRLRRTMATILGLNMDDQDHPLTLGSGMSGNSLVGDSLVLAQEDAREFLSLFAPELASKQEKKSVDEFFVRYANQVTVLLHGAARKLKDVVASILDEQMPAQLEWRILETDHPFVLGLSPLLAVDTWLEQRQPAERVTLDDTWLGREGVLKNPAAFSPRDVNARV